MTTTETTNIAHTGLPAGRWAIDPSHSEVGFSVRHLGLSKVRGHFKSFTGSVTASTQLSDAKVEATVDLSSVDTNNEQRDGHLLSADFFDVDNNATMTFNSTAIAVDSGESSGTITGELTIAGVSKPVHLDAEFNGVAVDAYGTTRAGFSAAATVSRKDFGIDFNVPLDAGGILIGDKVTIELEIQLVPTEG